MTHELRLLVAVGGFASWGNRPMWNPEKNGELAAQGSAQSFNVLCQLGAFSLPDLSKLSWCIEWCASVNRAKK